MRKLLFICYILCSLSSKSQGNLLDTFIGKQYYLSEKIINEDEDYLFSNKLIWTGDSVIIKKSEFALNDKCFDTILVFVDKRKARLHFSVCRFRYREEKGQLSIVPVKYKNLLVKKYGSESFFDMLDYTVKIGMKKEQVLLSWGKPDNINKTITKYSKNEQWVYDDGPSYLYFENGILTTIQD